MIHVLTFISISFMINSLTEVRVYNTTNTTAILSGVPYNVNITFVISAYNCERAGEQATLLIIIAGKHDIQLYSIIF